MIITIDIVIEIHKRIISTSGGIEGVRDLTLLDSAISSIYQTYNSKELYPTIIERQLDCVLLLIKTILFLMVIREFQCIYLQ